MKFYTLILILFNVINLINSFFNDVSNLALYYEDTGKIFSLNKFKKQKKILIFLKRLIKI